jgi:hypothetical protein
MKKFLTAMVSEMCLSAITTTASFAQCKNDVLVQGNGTW